MAHVRSIEQVYWNLWQAHDHVRASEKVEKLAADVVLSRGHGRLFHERMLGEHALDLDGGNILAGPPDHILLAIDEIHRAVGALTQLMRRGAVKPDIVKQALRKFGINPEKVSPMRA